MKVYKININIIRIVLFIIAMTIGLKSLNNFILSPDNDTVAVIKETKEVSLNDFLSGYHAGQYESIKLKNQTDLEGHMLRTTGVSTLANSGNSLHLMSLNKSLKIKDYTVFKSIKPIESSLTDLGISLTGTTKIDVSYEKQSFL